MAKLVDENFYEIMAVEKLHQIWDGLLAEGLVKGSAIVDLLDKHADFGNIDGRFCHESGMPADLYVRNVLLPARPHWAPQDVLTDEAELAWGENPSMKARGRRVKAIGVEAAKLEAAAWNASLNNLKPGTKPDGKSPAEKQAEQKSKFKERNNPFYRLRDPKTGAIDPVAQTRVQELIKVGGTKFAADLAKAANVDLSGRPLRGR
jgi:hypothetical protein